MWWISSIITIVLLYLAYAYLKGLKTCSCANDTYVTRLKNLEAILLGLNIIIFCFAILSSFHLFSALDKIKQHILKIAMLGGITMLIYHVFFVYNGYNFWKTLPAKCDCADKWEKYYIYLQTLLMFVALLVTTFFTGFLAYKKVKMGLVDEVGLNKYIDERKPSTPKKSRSRSSKRK